MMKVFPTPSEEVICSMARALFYGLKIVGLAPFSIQKQIKTRTGSRRNTSVKVSLFSKMGLLYNLIFVIQVEVISGLRPISEQSIKELSKSPIIEIMDSIVRQFGIAFTCWFIILYWAFRQKNAAIIVNRLSDVHFLLSVGQKENLSTRRAGLILAVHLASNALIWSSCTISSATLVQSFLEIVVINQMFFIVYWFIIEYSIILGVLAMEFEILNKSLLNLTESPNRIFFTSSSNGHLEVLSSSTHSHSQLASLELLYSIRTTLYEVSQDVAEFFSLPILFSIACFALTLLYDVYYLIIPVLIPTSDRSMHTYLNSVLWCFLIVYPLALLSFNVTETTKQARLTAKSVHKLLATARTKEIATKLRHFSYQLIHEDLSFTAYGFFSLDFTLLQSILGTTVTYLVIIIQFTHAENP